MPKIDKTKLKKYRTIQADPSLAIFRAIQEMEEKK